LTPPSRSTLLQYGESSDAIQAALAPSAEEHPSTAQNGPADGRRRADGEEEEEDGEAPEEDGEAPEEDSDDDLDIVTVAPQRSVDFRWV
jgi:hypothetical protein